MTGCRCLLVKPERMPDEMLWAMVLHGEHQYFTEIVHRYKGLVGYIAYRILKRGADIEDVIQATFLDIFRVRHQFDVHLAPFKAWLAMYARSRAIKHLDWLKRQGFYERGPMRTITKECRLVEKVLARELLSLLSRKQLRTVQLVCTQDFTAEEAAQIMHDTPHATRHHYYRGLAKMRVVARGGK